MIIGVIPASQTFMTSVAENHLPFCGEACLVDHDSMLIQCGYTAGEVKGDVDIPGHAEMT
jgi:hypothetical protein